MKKFISTIIESLPLSNYCYEFNSDNTHYICIIRFSSTCKFSQSLLVGVTSLPAGFSYFIACPGSSPILAISQPKPICL